MVFPGLTNASQVSKEYDCSSSSPTIANYTTAANAVYQIISPPSTDYKTSASSTSLNSSSNLVKAVSIPGVAGSSCSGVSAVGGVGTYYASVITAAQTALTASHQAGQQNVIIFISDGDANASATNVGNGKLRQPKPGSLEPVPSRNYRCPGCHGSGDLGVLGRLWRAQHRQHPAVAVRTRLPFPRAPRCSKSPPFRRSSTPTTHQAACRSILSPPSALSSRISDSAC